MEIAPERFDSSANARTSIQIPSAVDVICNLLVSVARTPAYAVAALLAGVKNGFAGGNYRSMNSGAGRRGDGRRESLH
jgi:hypothetical protein